MAAMDWGTSTGSYSSFSRVEVRYSRDYDVTGTSTTAGWAQDIRVIVVESWGSSAPITFAPTKPPRLVKDYFKKDLSVPWGLVVGEPIPRKGPYLVRGIRMKEWQVHRLRYSARDTRRRLSPLRS